ncbi:glycosyltransferase family 2 protein [Caloramator sp. E03]|uniref:glycosyltransferase family 2 protein n=1 Tax=Caloramator sp. E03 TaxID=2576307 RepID=UPI001110E210|nr:glycosyltransferase family A protein [Caloramator sp. E03]QCX34370.1 glycosyltransferase family 2 protein [Caloramator sp. E03]
MCKVSIIVPYYNSEKTIIRALDSIKNQTYKDFEIIIINDGSNDSSEKLVNKFINDNKNIKCKHLNQKNKGPSSARNLGIKSSKGEYIAFLDSDDTWENNKLEEQINFLEKHKDYYILGTQNNIIIKGKKLNKIKTNDYFTEITFYKRLFKNYFITPSVIINKKALEEIGLFNEEQRYAEDQLLFMRVLRKFKGGIINIPLCTTYKYLYGDNGLSANMKMCEKFEIRNLILLYKENNKSEKKISFALLILLIIFSYLKYLRRILIVKLRKYRWLNEKNYFC